MDLTILNEIKHIVERESFMIPPPVYISPKSMANYLLMATGHGEVGLVLDIAKIVPKVVKGIGLFATDGVHFLIDEQMLIHETYEKMWGIPSDYVPYIATFLWQYASIHEAGHVKLAYLNNIPVLEQIPDMVKKINRSDVPENVQKTLCQIVLDHILEFHLLPNEHFIVNEYLRYGQQLLFTKEFLEFNNAGFNTLTKLYYSRTPDENLLNSVINSDDVTRQLYDKLLEYDGNYSNMDNSNIYRVMNEMLDLLKDNFDENNDTIYDDIIDGESDECESDSDFNRVIEEAIAAQQERKEIDSSFNTFLEKSTLEDINKLGLRGHSLVPTPDVTSYIEDFKMKDYKIKKVLKHQRKGLLDDTSFYRIGYSDDVYRSKKITKRKRYIRPSVTFLVDQSGSMSDHLSELAASYCYQIYRAFASEDVSCAFYSYTTYGSGGVITGIASYKMPFCDSDYPVTTPDFKQRFEKVADVGKGGTPDSFAIRFAREQIEKHGVGENTSNLIVIICDGGANVSYGYSSPYEEVQYEIGKCQELGIGFAAMSLDSFIDNDLISTYGRENVYTLWNDKIRDKEIIRFLDKIDTTED